MYAEISGKPKGQGVVVRRDVIIADSELIASGYAFAGTVAMEKRQPVDWVFCYTYNSLVLHPVLIESVEAFWTKVMPRFR